MGKGKTKNVPVKNWTLERPFDSADYLDGPAPRYMTSLEAQKFEKKKKKKA